MKKLLILSILSLITTLQGCDNIQTQSETKSTAEVDSEIKSQRDKNPDVAKIELPQKTTQDSYVYQNDDLKSPFSKIDDIEQQSSGIKPDFDRKKEELENYALSNIVLKGTMSVKNGPREALVMTGDGKIHTVEVGNFMGKNYGKVLSIKEEVMKVRELYKNAENVWSIKMVTKNQK